MKYITKQIYLTSRFYERLSYGNLPYEEFLIEKTRNLEGLDKYGKGTAKSIQLLHKENVQQNVCKELCDFEELKEIIYDENQEIRPLNLNIYNQISNLRKRHQERLSTCYNSVAGIASKIKTGNYSDGVKTLAMLNKQCKIISVCRKKSRLELIYEIYKDAFETYVFYVPDTFDCSQINLYVVYKVVCEELIPCFDGSLDYNLLIKIYNYRKSTEYWNEITINFLNVEIKK
ncbi:MAG: hypothetical protein LBS21_10610 [Clostridiales bacterium]|jgi:hypothetical protein|nr:hypothetical protein [Clostridiales bacterium]